MRKWATKLRDEKVRPSQMSTDTAYEILCFTPPVLLYTPCNHSPVGFVDCGW